MHRPAFIPDAAKPYLNFAKTWSKLYRLLQNPAPIQPKPLPAHLAAATSGARKQKLPVINGKGSVTNLMEAVMHIFMDKWSKADKAINLAIYTTRTSLAKRIHKKDPKTAYRHILALIEAGFLRAKVQVRGGLQLLLNPDILVFEGGRVAGPDMGAALRSVPATAPMAPLALMQAGQANLLALASFMNQNEKGRKRS
ncbi:hypothetical protein [Hymenobacter terricola]|uniref:hypothetical protein n=1 Tax=Hymenobacter terricola TaxID=2819236 RepID=UPI001B317E0B|nr:hypothetical protein [Hymenobacter terricola]